MDDLSLATDITRTERTIARTLIQLRCLNRRLNDIDIRCASAARHSRNMWVYKLRLRSVTVEGVKNVYMLYLEKKILELWALRERHLSVSEFSGSDLSEGEVELELDSAEELSDL